MNTYYIHSTLPDFPIRARFTGLKRLESRIYIDTIQDSGGARSTAIVPKASYYRGVLEYLILSPSILDISYN